MKEIFNKIPLSYYTYSALINCITTTCLGLFFIFKTWKIKQNRIFGLFSLAVGIWSFYYFLWMSADTAELQGFYLRTCMIPIAFSSSFFLHFVILLTGKKRRMFLLKLSYIFSILFATVVYRNDFASDGAPFYTIPLWLKAGPLLHLYILHFTLATIYSFYLLIEKVSLTMGRERIKLIYILIGLLLTYFGGMSNYLVWYRIPPPPIFNILVSCYVLMMAYVIIKHKLWGISLIIRKSSIVVAIAVILTNLFLILVIISERLLGNLIGLSSSVFHFIRFSLFVWAVILFYRIAHKNIKKMFLNNEQAEKQELEILSSYIATELDFDGMLNLVIDEIEAIVGVRNVVVGVYDEKVKDFKMKVTTGYEEDIYKKDINLENPLVEELLNKQGFMVKGWLDDSEEKQREIIEEMKLLDIEICIALMLDEEIVGFLGLGVKRRNKKYTLDEIEVLQEFSNKFAIALKNAVKHHLLERKYRVTSDFLEIFGGKGLVSDDEE